MYTCTSRDELQVFLEHLGITFTKKRWIAIFREVDRNFDNEISFEEMYLFMFPEEKSAQVCIIEYICVDVYIIMHLYLSIYMNIYDKFLSIQ